MSTQVYDERGVYVTRVCAPASEGADRLRWEVFVPDPVRLTKAQVLDLAAALQESVDA